MAGSKKKTSKGQKLAASKSRSSATVAVKRSKPGKSVSTKSVKTVAKSVLKKAAIKFAQARVAAAKVAASKAAAGKLAKSAAAVARQKAVAAASKSGKSAIASAKEAGKAVNKAKVLAPSRAAASKPAPQLVAAAKSVATPAMKSAPVPVKENSGLRAVASAAGEPVMGKPAAGKATGGKSPVSKSTVVAGKGKAAASPAGSTTVVRPPQVAGRIATGSTASHPAGTPVAAMPTKPGLSIVGIPASARFAHGARPGVRPGVKPAPAKIEFKAAAKPGSHRTGFKALEFIVYPAHGVGQIVAIEEQEVAGYKMELFVISFAKDKMTLKVPLPKVINGAIRKLADADDVRRSLDTLMGRARIKRTMWSRRAQEYEAKINSGDLGSIAEVVRDLYRSEAQPEQSYSERQLYEAALDRMAREVAVVNRILENEALKLIDSHLQRGPKRGAKTDAAAEGGADIVEAA